MAILSLEELKLEVLSVDILEARSLLGGMSGYLSEVVVTGVNLPHPEGPDNDNDYLDHDQDDQDGQDGHDQDNNDDLHTNSIQNFNPSCGTQIGPTCVFFSVAAALGVSTVKPIIDNYITYCQQNDLKAWGPSLTPIGSNIQGFLESQYGGQIVNDFSGVKESIDNNSSLLAYREIGTTTINVDNNGDGINDGTQTIELTHEVVIIGYNDRGDNDSSNDLYQYWDPQTGESSWADASKFHEIMSINN